MSIPVKAKQLGFYGAKLRAEDEEFQIENESELGRWMQRLDGGPSREDLEAAAADKALKDAEVAKAPIVKVEAPLALEDMKASELIAFAAKNGLAIGDMVPQNGRDKILAAVKVALAAWATAQ